VKDPAYEESGYLYQIDNVLPQNGVVFKELLSKKNREEGSPPAYGIIKEGLKYNKN
jgi:hypothetical protein